MGKPKSSVQYHTFSSDADLATAVAGRWIEFVRSGRCRTLAVSGGRIANRLFQATVRVSQSERVSWAGIHCFWADERCVPPDHEASNYRLAKQAFLDPLGWADHRIHRLKGEIQPEEAARQGESELRALTGAEGRLDLALLGMGEDGHIASLFPGSSTGQSELERYYLAVESPKPPSKRVTLSFHALAQALHVWVIISGAGKGTSLKQALAGQVDRPLGRLILLRDSTQLFSSVDLTEI